MQAHICCLVAVVALPGASLLGQALSFLPPVSALYSGTAPSAEMCRSCVATADFNGDGRMDIVYTTTRSTADIGVSLGNGDGTFRPGNTFERFDRNDHNVPFVGDFNGDGKVDVLISREFEGGRTWIFPGDGKGNFGDSVTVPNCSRVSAGADLNGDGRQDLVCSVSILLGNVDGTFRPGPGTLRGTSVLAADFNRDGIPDILLSPGAGQLAVVLGRGDGSFGSAIQISTPLDSSSIRVGDLNGDGRLDLVGTTADGKNFAVIMGRGDGGFGVAVVTSYALGLATAVADLNGDGKQDVIAGDALLAGNGDGTFRFPVFVGVVAEYCDKTLPGSSNYPCWHSTQAAAVADFNGDGLPDIAAGYIAVQPLMHREYAAVSVLLNDGPGDGFYATGVSSATRMWPVAPGSLVSAFGVNLASTTESATTNPLPTTLGGIRLHVRERSHPNDRLAPLLYVSPTQINYLVESSDDYVSVSIERIGSPFVVHAMSVPTYPDGLVPGLFTLSPGLAAATTVRVGSDGNQTPAPVTTCNGSTCNSVPIDLSAGTVYLSLYGTGFADASADYSTCAVAGRSLPVQYAGPQRQMQGLDQINVILPASLAGAGEATVACSLARKSATSAMYNAPSNAVKISIH
jgi:uncharacterized protein (TIGR03437 family)